MFAAPPVYFVATARPQVPSAKSPRDHLSRWQPPQRRVETEYRRRWVADGVEGRMWAIIVQEKETNSVKLKERPNDVERGKRERKMSLLMP
ncbi:unnamed protein product [Protopolystoma xenopodis]|uniref:Uncharacterized protein n=1 Tax=Protopolystoma xenopodis TaxID=117903 RepID=A0A3S5BG20_9PLAT|nr:unnamed protein product [Protopolystoma xenopodis]